MIQLVFYIWWSYLFLAIAYEVFTAIHKHFALKLNTHVYNIQNTNAYEVLSWQPHIFYI